MHSHGYRSIFPAALTTPCSSLTLQHSQHMLQTEATLVPGQAHGQWPRPGPGDAVVLRNQSTGLSVLATTACGRERSSLSTLPGLAALGPDIFLTTRRRANCFPRAAKSALLMAASGNKAYKASGSAASVTTQGKKSPQWHCGQLGEKLRSAGR